ncbi:MAG: TonB-dependent receptor [Bacteroidales bacterium]|nr:TonB-dependent receptor [Bacteroidales bacterium]
MSIKKILSALVICLIAVLLHAQNQDTVAQWLRAVEVTGVPDALGRGSGVPLQILEGETLQKLSVLQMSDALKLMSGILVKDWGGAGGLKTVSVRGFGAQHTGVAYDGLPVIDCQTGQIDLGKFSLENMQEMSLISGNSDNIFMPARMLAYSNLIEMHSKKPVFKAEKPVNLSVGFTGGSWALLNPTLRLENRLMKKHNGRSLSSSVNLNYLYSKGNYPYQIHYGGATDSTSRDRRTNSDMQSLTAEGNLYARLDDSTQLNLKIYYYKSERGLPGAIIYYRQGAGQRLWDDNFFTQFRFQKKATARWVFRMDAKYNYAKQRYLDPDYLNMEHRLDNKYRQQEAYLSAAAHYSPHKLISLNVAQDLFYNGMTANIRDFANPHRITLLSALSGKLEIRQFTAVAGLLHTLAFHWVELGEAAKPTNNAAPYVNLSVKPLKREDFYIRLFYKNSFRMPTFNDLYYREVGNLSLKPEKGHQLNGGLAYRKYWQGKWMLSATCDAYYNMVLDKIVAIPSKNLFIWSMLNYGRVEIAGADVNLTGSFKWSKRVRLELTGHYTFQRAIDLTDRNSKSYRHQIPYTPHHTGSATLLLSTAWFNLSYTLLVSGERYVLPLNRPANRLAPYTDHSLALMHEFKLKAVTLGLKAELLNIANTQYEVIRNYPMQGRSFRTGAWVKW